MKFADPMKVTCPGCGGETFHSVASLQALQAECPLCHASLREAGERMNAMEREVQNGAIAMGIIIAMEEFDDRIKFGDDFDYEDLNCLNDVIALADRAIANLPLANRPRSGTELVESVIREALPSVDCPPKHLPLVEAFAGQGKLLNEWFWHGSRRRPTTKSRA